MSANVLFDAPGPKARARHRILTVVGLLALLAIAYWIYGRMDEKNQFTAARWSPFLTWAAWDNYIIPGMLATLRAAALAIVIAGGLALLLALARMSDIRPLRWASSVFVEFFRAVPVLMLMIFFFSIYGIYNGTSGPFWCVVWALSLYNGAVLAEVFRAGLLAVPKGQSEAAYAIGMRKSQVVWIVLLPQAVKIMIPAIISQCVVTLKDTSLGYAIAAPGLTAVARPIYLEFQNHIPVYLVIAALYIVVNLVLTALATWVQKRFVGERKQLQVTMVGEAQSERGTGTV